MQTSGYGEFSAKGFRDLSNDLEELFRFLTEMLNYYQSKCLTPVITQSTDSLEYIKSINYEKKRTLNSKKYSFCSTMSLNVPISSSGLPSKNQISYWV